MPPSSDRDFHPVFVIYQLWQVVILFTMHCQLVLILKHTFLTKSRFLVNGVEKLDKIAKNAESAILLAVFFVLNE